MMFDEPGIHTGSASAAVSNPISHVLWASPEVTPPGGSRGSGAQPPPPHTTNFISGDSL